MEASSFCMRILLHCLGSQQFNYILLQYSILNHKSLPFLKAIFAALQPPERWN